jgi:ABC-2 type transport system permease protein
MKAGSLPWLLSHELRLWWREISVKRTGIFVTIALGLLFGGLFLWLWSTLAGVRIHTNFDSYLWMAVFLWLFGFFYSFTQGMGHSLVALFERGDSDLLLGSPIPAQVIFASRLLSVALKIFLSASVFVVPVTLIAVLIGIPQLLGLYPTLIGLSLIGASLTMLVILGLVRRFGARQARTLTQILTTFFSALLFLTFQLPNLLQGTKTTQNWQRFQVWFQQGSPLGADSPVWFPARAIFFDPTAVLLTLLVSGGFAWMTVVIGNRAFLAGTQQSLTRKHSAPKKSTSFNSGINRIVLLKEWRIIWRNPYLISRIFLQILFLIPALVIILRGGRRIADLPTFVIMVSVAVGGILTLSLTRICVSGEESPDLLKSAPIDGSVFRRLKILAVLIPVWLLFSPLFIILVVKGEAWLIPLMIFLASTTCAAILRLWNSRPIPLTSIFKRQSNAQGDLLLNTIELASLWTWGWLGVSLHQGNAVLIPLVVICLGLAIAYTRSRQLGSNLGF